MPAPVRKPVPSSRRFLVQGVSAFALFCGVESCFAGAATNSDEGVAELPTITIEASTPENSAPESPVPEGFGVEGSAASGYRTYTGSLGPLGKLPLQDIPYSLNVTPGQLIENTNAHSIGDALMTNPTATLLMSSGGYSSMSRMMIRGFTAADQDEMRDGLVDRSFTFVPLENVERIEVLNGLSGFLNGFSEPGGSINYISKNPTSVPLATLATGIYGGGIGFIHADLGGKVPENDDRFGYRINLYHEDGETTISNSAQNRTLESARFTYDLTPDTKLWTDVYHQDLYMRGLQTYINPVSGVVLPDASTFNMRRQYGQDWTFNQSEKTVVGFGLDSRINDVFSVRAGYRYGVMWRFYNYVDGTITNNAGSYTEKNTASPRQFEYTHSEYALLDAHVPTWFLTHNFTMGHTGTDYLYSRGSDVSTMLPASTVEAPIVSANPNLLLGPTNQWQQQIFSSFLFGDRIVVTEQLSLLAGVNYAQLKQIAWGPGTAISTADFDAGAATPSVGLTYKFLPNVTGYASYIQALEGGDTAPATAANANQVLAPSISQQYETGVKAALGEMNLSAALFRIDKVNAELNPNNNVYMQDGREIHQGLEVIGSGKLTGDLAAVGGFTLMHAYVAQATASPATIGKIPVNVPQQQARLLLEHALPFFRDIKVSFGPEFMGARPIDVYNQQFIKATTIFFAGVRLERELFGHKISANLTVQNLFNQSYWAYYRSGDGLLLGTPRTIALTVKAAW